MSLTNLVQPKRGYLANILTIPPLIYPFQYNPASLSDHKTFEWGTRTPIPPQETIGAITSLASGSAGAIGGVFTGLKEALGIAFSNAELHQLTKEGDRTLRFQFTVDGREQRPGEPARRRNEKGDILADLAIIRSFTYPALADLLEFMGAAFGGTQNANLFFKEPPTA